jgi:hypothetical protein
MARILHLLAYGAVITPLLYAGAFANSRRLQAPPTPQIRTYVSGLGDDSGPCTETAPCRTFQTAVGLTLAGGQIFVLDSANYGPVTIDKALTIVSEGGVAGILATKGVGIKVYAGANDVVTLRGLDIDGGGTATYGIYFSSGQALSIQKSSVRGFASSGINFAPTAASALLVSDSLLTNNTSQAVLIAPSGSGSASGTVNRVRASGNGVGIFASGANAKLMVNEVNAGTNTYGIGAASAASIMVRSSTIGHNSVGIAADQSAIVRVGQSSVTANQTGWQATNGGQIESYGNNNVNGNASDGAPSTTVTLR